MGLRHEAKDERVRLASRGYRWNSRMLVRLSETSARFETCFGIVTGDASGVRSHFCRNSETNVEMHPEIRGIASCYGRRVAATIFEKHSKRISGMAGQGRTQELNGPIHSQYCAEPSVVVRTQYTTGHFQRNETVCAAIYPRRARDQSRSERVATQRDLIGLLCRN
jgi:hypothetical protein